MSVENKPEENKPVETAPVVEEKPAEAEVKTTARKRTTRKTAAAKTTKTSARAKKTAAAETPVVQPLVVKDLKDPSLYINRELSWIEFDRKVLETAMDPQVPLLNRVLFLSIFYNNLDEFFMVRVKNLQTQARSGAAPTGPDRMTPAKQLSEIRKRVSGLLDEAENLWTNTLVPELAKKGIKFGKYSELNAKQKEALANYFEREIFPTLTPQAVDSGRPFPMVSNISINFVVELEDSKGKICYARVKRPDNTPRFLFISEDDTELKNFDIGARGTIIMAEDLIDSQLGYLFPNHKVKATGLFRITRNTDGEIEEDEADDLLAAVRDFVEKRQFGDVVRLEIERGMPSRLQEFLLAQLQLTQNQIFRCRIPLAFSAFGKMMAIDRPNLKYASSGPAHMLKAFDPERGSCFDAIKAQDQVVYHPYDSFNCVLEFLRQAARDPNVVAIKQTLYRCGSDSPVAKALLEARRNGKQVTAVVELKARFDESQNIAWAEEMDRNGVNVVYGFPGLKIHAKLCFVVRRERDGLHRYVHIGTGNYNAASAKIYTDLGLFTANEEICDDIQHLFNRMTGFGEKSYKRLFVSPNTLRGGVTQCIRDEIEQHKQHGNGHIIIKCNQLVDAEMIEELYKASQAGVRIECVVRGICMIRPGIPGVSETITVRSIVGKLLEHARVYWFNNNGDEKMYIGSADLMTRNLNGRIEVLTPILKPNLRRNIMEQIVLPQLKDNYHAWVMASDGSYKKLDPKSGEKTYDSQEEIAKVLNLLKK